MKILINQIDGDWESEGYWLKENDTGFWCYLNQTSSIPIKFPWKLYTYKIMEEV